MNLESPVLSSPTFSAAILHMVVGGLVWAFAGALLVFVILAMTVAAGFSVSDREGILFEIVGAIIGIPLGAILFARPTAWHGAAQGAKKAVIWWGGGSMILFVLLGFLILTREQLVPKMSNGQVLLMMAFCVALTLIPGVLIGAWLGSLIGWWRRDFNVRP